MDRLEEIEARSYKPSVLCSEADSCEECQEHFDVLWLIEEVKRLHLREETLAAVVKKQGLHIKRLVEGDQRTSDEDLRQRPTD